MKVNPNKSAGTAVTYDHCNEELIEIDGETKREKAFWQVYSAMLAANKEGFPYGREAFALDALHSVDAGFAALNKEES